VYYIKVMFAFVVFDLVFQYWAKISTGKCVSEINLIFVLGGVWNRNQSIVSESLLDAN